MFFSYSLTIGAVFSLDLYLAHECNSHLLLPVLRQGTADYVQNAGLLFTTETSSLCCFKGGVDGVLRSQILRLGLSSVMGVGVGEWAHSKR